MATVPEVSFHIDVAETEDENKAHVTVVLCHGRLVNKTVDQLKEVVKPLIARGGRIVLDLGDLAWMDSSGLGAVVSLKVSTLNKGGQCTLELMNLSPRVKELLSLSHLVQLFTIKPYPGSAFSYHLSALHRADDKQEDKSQR